jgi:enoyl-[acyl-carrier protein] reductase I
MLSGKFGLIVGVANKRSIAWAIAQAAAAQGARLALTYPSARLEENVRELAAQLDNPLLAPCDVASDEQIADLAATIDKEFGGLDFFVHGAAFAPGPELSNPFLQTSREGFRIALDVSAYSLVALARAAGPLMTEGGSIVAMTYYGGEKVVPGYNVMGICKAALDACVKYAAFDLGPAGVRVNAISAGPLRTLAARAVGSDGMEEVYSRMAPLGRNITHEEVGRTGAFLMSAASEGITGEILHVDAGYNIMGSPGRMLDAFKK